MTDTLNHLDEFRLLFRGGKLWSKDGWRNVDEHQITQTEGATVIGKLLGLNAGDRKKMETVALVHDWRKRLDKFPQDFSEEDRLNAEKWLQRVDPDYSLMKATGTDFLQIFLEGKSTLLERIQFYLDDITRGGDVVRFDERIDEVSKRRPELNEDQELTRRLGGKKYWEVEREIGHRVEAELYEMLTGRGVLLNTQQEIPDLIASEINKANA